jgi:hypothetical protein
VVTKKKKDCGVVRARARGRGSMKIRLKMARIAKVCDLGFRLKNNPKPLKDGQDGQSSWMWRGAYKIITKFCSSRSRAVTAGSGLCPHCAGGRQRSAGLLGAEVHEVYSEKSVPWYIYYTKGTV